MVATSSTGLICSVSPCRSACPVCPACSVIRTPRGVDVVELVAQQDGRFLGVEGLGPVRREGDEHVVDVGRAEHLVELVLGVLGRQEALGVLVALDLRALAQVTPEGIGQLALELGEFAQRLAVLHLRQRDFGDERVAVLALVRAHADALDAQPVDGLAVAPALGGRQAPPGLLEHRLGFPAAQHHVIAVLIDVGAEFILARDREQPLGERGVGASLGGPARGVLAGLGVLRLLPGLGGGRTVGVVDLDHGVADAGAERGEGQDGGQGEGERPTWAPGRRGLRGAFGIRRVRGLQVLGGLQDFRLGHSRSHWRSARSMARFMLIGRVSDR